MDIHTMHFETIDSRFQVAHTLPPKHHHVQARCAVVLLEELSSTRDKIQIILLTNKHRYLISNTNCEVEQ